MKLTGKIRNIFLNYNAWEIYCKIRKPNENVLENVKKMLICRTPLLGKHVYVCENCKKEIEIPHSCKSRFCSSCGTISTANWIVSRFNFLLDCSYHHVVVTIPGGYRGIMRLNKKKALNLFAKCAAETIMQWSKSRGYEVGIICFFHSFGSKLQFHPHFHMLVSAGGVTKEGKWRYTNEAMPGDILMKVFRAKFTRGMRNLLKYQIKKSKNHGWIMNTLQRKYEEHWQFYTERITNCGTITMEYCVRYAKKMILSEKRIVDYSNDGVTFESGKIKGQGKVPITYPIMQFIGCVVQHIPPKWFRLIRYYGFYANKSKKKYLVARKYWEPLQDKSKPALWRERQVWLTGLDPLWCIVCHRLLILRSITYPKPLYQISYETIKEIFELDKNGIEQVEYG